MKDSLNRRLLKSIWAVLSWMVLALLVCAMAIGTYFYFRADNELKTFIESRIAEYYPDLTITINDTRLLRNEGIRIRGISIVEPADTKKGRSEPVFIEEVFLRCPTDLASLLKGNVSIQRVHVRGLVLRGIRRSSGEVNLASLLPQNLEQKKKQRLPIISIENSTIEFIDRMSALANLITLQRVHTKIVPKYVSANPSRPPLLEIEASFDHDDLRTSHMVGAIDLATGSWKVDGNATGLSLSPSLFRMVPSKFGAIRELLDPLRAQANLVFSASAPDLKARPNFFVDARIQDGQFSLPRYSHPISGISASIVLDHEQVQVKDLKANFGTGKVVLSLQKNGYLRNSPMLVHVEATNLLIDENLVSLLPQNAQASWRKFRPLGAVSGDATLSFNGRTWNYDSEIKCRDVSLQYHRFQYPLTRASGRLTAKKGKLQFQLTGASGNTPMTVQGDWQNPGPKATGWCRVETKEWMPIDDHLQKAIRKTYPGAGRIVQQLNPRGKIHISAFFEKLEPKIGPARPKITIAIRDGWMKYEKFPYPINDIVGQIQLDGSHWTFRDFKGYNDSCMITCNGALDPTRAADHLTLNLTANQIALDDELKAALPASVRRIWLDLRPEGSVDFSKIGIAYTNGTNTPRVEISAAKFAQNRGRDLSIHPFWFPYQLDRVSGNATYQDGRVEVRRLTGHHGSARLTSDLIAEFDSHGRWQARFKKIAARGLRTDDHELFEALPSGLVTAMSSLGLEGHMAVNGELTFRGNGENDTLKGNWDLRVDLDQAKFQPGILIDNIHGAVRLRGNSQGNKIQCRGDLDLQMAMYQGIPFQDVRGPIWLSGSRIWGGASIPVSKRTDRLPSIQSNVHDGTLRFDFNANLAETPAFAVQASLDNADLSSFARDNIPNNSGLKGRVAGRLNLTGNASGNHTLRGVGTARISDANLYELPVILALLKRLRYGAEDAAVLTSNMNFNIEGENVYFGIQRSDGQNTDAGITITGDAVTLKGSGRVGFNRDVEMEFYTLVGREKLWSPVIRPLVGEASRQFLKIRVDGTLDEPRTVQEVLPGLNETLRYWFPEAVSRETKTTDPKKRFSLRRSRVR